MVAIFVALMFVGLVLVDLGLVKWREWRALHARREALAMGPNANGAAFGLESLGQLPEGVCLSNGHTWLKPDPTGGLEVGADAFIAHAVGAVRQVTLPKAGSEVSAGQPLCKLECDDRSLAIPSTVTGRVLAVNTRLQERPELLTLDPYGSGWICYVTPTRVDDHATSARFGEKAALWLEAEFARLREFISAQTSADLALGTTSQDGGVPTFGCLHGRDPVVWKAFEVEFLRPEREGVFVAVSEIH